MTSARYEEYISKYNLRRFVDTHRQIYSSALNEIRSGKKRSHWMWYIFPQLRGLGHSRNAEYYGIADRDEAIIAFLDSHDYESAIRLAVSLGGDSDTIACMTGGIAAAYYGIPAWIVKYVVTEYLPQNMREIIELFDATYLSISPTDEVSTEK